MLEGAILFIGLGTNKYRLNEIVETSSLSFVEENYGIDSVFYTACNIGLRFANKPQFMFLNLNSWEDIKNHSNTIRDLEIDCIVPLGLQLDETYYDTYYDKVITHTQILLAILNESLSTVIMTGKHASNYQTLDAYLSEDALDEDGTIKEKCEFTRLKNIEKYLAGVNRENLIYVANNLSGIEFANVVLAVMLTETDYAEYPIYGNLPDAVFEIDFADISNNLVYFKNNHITGTTVENLVNFSTDYTMKLVTVKRILKYFSYHQPHIEKYIGQAYFEYKKVQIVEALQEYLSSLVGWIIYKYDIYSVTDISTQPGTVDIILNYDIWPKFTTEKYTIQTGG